MDIQENRPYLPFLAAMLAAAEPLCVLLSDAYALAAGHPAGVLFAHRAGRVVVLPADGETLFAAAVVFVLNGIVSFMLARSARQKMMRRHWRYALYLAGTGALAAWLFGSALGVALGLGAKAGSGAWLACYAVSVLLLALCFLPKQLTRAPVQTITVYRDNYRRKRRE